MQSKLTLKRSYIILILLLLQLTAEGQKTVKGKVVEATSEQTVSFINIQIESSSIGTMTDLDGFFQLEIPSSAKTIIFSGIGYQTLRIATDSLQSPIRMEKKTIALSEVEVSPLSNPANRLMPSVIRQIENHHPYSVPFKAILYHKMTFRFEQKEFAPAEFKENDFLLIESVSEKLHQPPHHHTENMLSGRVSGFRQPSLSFVPAQIQPFTFFEKEITLLGQKYLNPLSEDGLRQYYFTLEDTLTTSTGDTLYYISFLARKGSWSHTLKGSLHVNHSTLAIQSISAETATMNAPFSIAIRQKYDPVGSDSIWFPKQLESLLILSNAPDRGGTIVASGKSYVASVELNPKFKKDAFRGAHFSDAQINNLPSMLDHFRHQPLTASDSATLRLLDSIAMRTPLDHLIGLQRNLLKGEIPIGKISIEYPRIIQFNSFEGLKTGLGLKTNENFHPQFALGGYALYGWGDQRWKYGTNMEWNSQKTGKVTIFWKNDVIETGGYRLIDGFDPSSPELFRTFLSESMNYEQSTGLDWENYLLRNLKASIGYRYTITLPAQSYPFELVVSQPAPEYEMHEVKIALKWSPGQRRMENALGNFITPSKAPQLWMNLEVGHSADTSDYNYKRLVYRIQQPIRWATWSKTTLSLEGGVIAGKYPALKLFSAMGTRKNFGIEIPNSLATMRPNEFAARHFEMATVRQTFYLGQNSSEKFKPELHALITGAWSNQNDHYRTFNMGYYEAGLVADNLFRLLLIQYGIGVHYRLGAYHMKKEAENWAVNLSIRFSL